MLRFEVHTHTEYSNARLLDSINTVKGVIDYALEQGLAGVAITDHDFTGSWVKVEKARKKHPNLKVIFGNGIKKKL